MKRLVLVAFALVLLATTLPPAREARAQIPEPLGSAPNILLIVTDDQRLGMMDVMPETERIFGAEGVRYPNAYVTTPLCCPSRASIFTGQYAHNHGVLINAGDPALDHNNTIQRYLRDAGYQTAISGKFLNTWQLETNPPFFDKWSVFRKGYNRSTWNVEGVLTEVSEYATDFVGSQAMSYVNDFETQDARPWFMQVSPGAAHKPFVPADEYLDARVPAWEYNPGVREDDRKDKPKFVRTRRAPFYRAQSVYMRQEKTLLSVDDMVSELFEQLEVLGEAENTLAFFISDNGFMHGEHGLVGKRFPYTESIKVPFYMRWPGHVEGGTVDPRIALNIDITPTIMEAVELPSEGQPLPVDGISLRGEDQHELVFMEQWGNPNRSLPDWISVRTEEFQFVRYFERHDPRKVSEREYYDLTEDKWQLTNLLGDTTMRNDPNLRLVQEKIVDYRTCVGPAECP